MLNAIQLAAGDNVATLLADAAKGDRMAILSANNDVIGELTCLQAIPFGNKVAVSAIETGQTIIKGGYPVGRAIAAIPVGQLVHVQNVRSLRLDIPDNIIDEIIKQMGIEA
ncbi:UxaA family hydrolase [Ferrimonas balearica]|uniref:UxaA family hydrolase n=1 Tax=Ferrimonas balearica TaxID=44012 RepID=UPI001F2E27A2|nr:UxaA family hydrolase [Ferrimonas balearica]MBY6095974.1 UxaA family hydrolase [Ferrimonas balearica]